MRRQPLRRLLPAGLAVAFLLFTAFAPSGVAERGNFHDYKLVQGPGSLDFKYSVCGQGISIVEPGAPITTLVTCPVTPLVLGPGVAKFDLSFLNNPFGEPPFPQMVRIWAEQVYGIAPPDPTHGFSMTVCSDRDDDGTCTNMDPVPSGTHPLHPWYDDQYKTQYSNSPAIQLAATGGVLGQQVDTGEPCKQYADQGRPPDPQEKEQDQGKDSKGCGSSWEAEVWMCVLPDAITNFPPPAEEFDDLWVFISDWVDEPLLFANDKENLGTGLSVGNYAIFAEYFPQEPCEVWD